MIKTFLKTTLFIIFFFTFINKANAQFKILDDLKKTGEQILKEQEQDKTKEKSTKPATATPATPPAKTQQDTKPAPSAPVKPTEKPPQVVKIKHTPFSKSFRMLCTYTGNNQVKQFTYAVEGKDFLINGFNIELGVEAGGMLATRQGSSNTVKLVNNQSGIVQTIMVDFDKLKADQHVAPLNVTLIGVCQKI